MVTKLEQYYIDNNIKYGFITYKNPKYNGIVYKTEPYFIKRAVPRFVVVKQNLEKQYRRTLSSRVIRKFNNLGQQTDTLLEMFVLIDNRNNIAKRILYSAYLDFQVEFNVYVTYDVTINPKKTLLEQQVFKYQDKYASWVTPKEQPQKQVNAKLVRHTILENNFHLVTKLNEMYKDTLTSIATLVEVAALINRGLVTSVTIPVETKMNQHMSLTLKVNPLIKKVEVTVN